MVVIDRGEGIVIVKNSIFNISGNGFLCIYLIGDINVLDIIGLLKGLFIVVIEGKNLIELNKCDLIGYVIGCGIGGVDDIGVMIY